MVALFKEIIALQYRITVKAQQKMKSLKKNQLSKKRRLKMIAQLRNPLDSHWLQLKNSMNKKKDI